MNTLTKKQRRDFLAEFSPSPGYILKLSRAQFEDLVEDAAGVDIEDLEGSNGARFQHLLKTLTDEQIDNLITALRNI